MVYSSHEWGSLSLVRCTLLLQSGDPGSTPGKSPFFSISKTCTEISFSFFLNFSLFSGHRPKAPKYYICILCSKHPKPKDRRKVNKELAKILRRNYMIDSKSDSFICHKCVHRCHKQKNERDLPEKMTASMAKEADSQSVTVNSPPSVNLSLPRTSLGHSYCFVCKKPGPKLVIPSVRTRVLP